MISDIMAHSYIVAINFAMPKKIIWVLMIIKSYHYGRKGLSNLLQIEPYNDMFKVISDIMAHCHDMWNTFINL